jgi:hypothetical protein
MASPLVASCAALLQHALLQKQSPLLTPLELRNALIENGGAAVTDVNGRSFPSLDCRQAYQALSIDEAPVLTRLSPQASLTTSDNAQQFSITALDQEDGDISSQVTWWVNNANTEHTGKNFSHTFDSGIHTVTAKVKDSANNETQITWQLTIDELPVLTRLSPQESLTTMHSTIAFSLNAQDNEDGDIRSQVTWWINDVDTEKTGGSFEYDSFVLGEYYIVTAKVVDSANNEVTLEWQVSIISLPYPPPEIIISSPSDGNQYDSGQEVSFSATATDQNDGDISADTQWLFNDEVIVQAISFSRVFEAGTHTVIARVKNSIENISQTEVTFTVNEPIPPVVTPPPIVTPPPSSSSSGGGAIGMGLFMLLLIFVFHRQLLVRKS